MTDSPRSRSRLPHWGWFLLAMVVLVVGYVGLSVCLPYHREQQVIQQIEGWGGRVETETGGPEWVRKVVGNDRMTESEVFDRVFGVIAHGTTITDADIAHLSRLPKRPATLPDMRPARCNSGIDERSLRITLIWIMAYLASVAILFASMTSGGWVRLSYAPELLFSLIVPLLVLRLFGYFLRLGVFFQQYRRRR